MKKMLPWLVSLLLAITLIVLVGIFVWKQYLTNSGPQDPESAVKAAVADVKAKPMTADELVKVASELTDIKTNIKNTDYVVIMSFTFQLDTEKAKTEFDKIKEMLVKPIINRELWELTQEQLQGSKGKDELCSRLINSINKAISEGKITKVEIKDFIMQQV